MPPYLHHTVEDHTSDPGAGTYLESLRVPLRWWAITTMFLASLVLAFLVALPPLVAVALCAPVIAVAVVFLTLYGGARISVHDGFLEAGRARIPVALLRDPRPLDEEEARVMAGPGADARAFLLVRPYLDRAVVVGVQDPADPTPYWLIGTRHPQSLAEALSTAIDRAHDQPS